MSRTIIKFTSPFNSNAVFDAFGKFMYRENFEFVQKNGEQYWKKGVGLLTAPQFLKLSVNNDGSYVLEAWIKFAILPGLSLIHISEPTRQAEISYAVFCLKKKKKKVVVKGLL